MNEELTREAIAIWQDPEHCTEFIKGRVALYAILRAMGCAEGDEVVMPGFTCVVVAGAIRYTGAKPVFYDIDKATLQGDPNSAVKAITPRTRAVIVQHNFGGIAPLGELLGVCSERGVSIIEDCAHAIGAIHDRNPVGTIGDAAFCSLQWSKPTTTGLGGIARCKDSELARKVRGLAAKEFCEPPILTTTYLRILSSAYRRFYKPSWYWRAQGIYRWAGRAGLVQGSSSDEELNTDSMPRGYRSRFGSSRSRSLKKALEGLPNLLAHRRKIHRLYRARLANLGTWLPPEDAEGSLGGALRFPLLVSNRDSLLSWARTERIELGDWFNASLHPHGCEPAAFGYRSGECPVAEQVANQVVNLPTHLQVDEQEVERILEFVVKHAKLIPAINSFVLQKGDSS